VEPYSLVGDYKFWKNLLPLCSNSLVWNDYKHLPNCTESQFVRLQTQSSALPHFQMAYSPHLILVTVSSTDWCTRSKVFFYFFYFCHSFLQLSVSYPFHFLEEICSWSEFQEVRGIQHETSCQWKQLTIQIQIWVTHNYADENFFWNVTHCRLVNAY
jgi:hypothetical protein